MDPHALSQRIEELAQASGVESDQRRDALSPVLRELTGEIVAARTDLAALRDDTSTLRGDLDELSGGLGRSVAAGRTETGALVGRLSGLTDRVDAIGARLEDVHDELPGLVGDGREVVPALESRLAVLEEALDATAERLESLARDGAHTTRDALRELGKGLRALDRRVGALSEQNRGRSDAFAAAVAEVRSGSAGLAGSRRWGAAWSRPSRA